MTRTVPILKPIREWLATYQGEPFTAAECAAILGLPTNNVRCALDRLMRERGIVQKVGSKPLVLGKQINRKAERLWARVQRG